MAWLIFAELGGVRGGKLVWYQNDVRGQEAPEESECFPSADYCEICGWASLGNNAQIFGLSKNKSQNTAGCVKSLPRMQVLTALWPGRKHCMVGFSKAQKQELTAMVRKLCTKVLLPAKNTVKHMTLAADSLVNLALAQPTESDSWWLTDLQTAELGGVQGGKPCLVSKWWEIRGKQCCNLQVFGISGPIKYRFLVQSAWIPLPFLRH